MTRQRVEYFVLLSLSSRVIAILLDFGLEQSMCEKSKVEILSTKTSHSNYNAPEVSIEIDAFFMR